LAASLARRAAWRGSLIERITPMSSNSASAHHAAMKSGSTSSAHRVASVAAARLAGVRAAETSRALVSRASASMRRDPRIGAGDPASICRWIGTPIRAPAP